VLGLKLRTVRRLHKWLTLLIGLPLLTWSISGLYFTLFDIHHIHGEDLLKPAATFTPHEQNKFGFGYVLEHYPQATKLAMLRVDSQTYLRFWDTKLASWQRLNTQTGELAPPLDAEAATRIAKAQFNGSAPVKSVQLFTQQAPFELSPRHLPVWQITFDDLQGSTLYIQQITGEVVTKRHLWWRGFDVFWRFHILDYEGEDVANPLLTTAASIALLTTVSGLILSVFWLRRKKCKRSKR